MSQLKQNRKETKKNFMRKDLNIYIYIYIYNFQTFNTTETGNSTRQINRFCLLYVRVISERKTAIIIM